MTEFQVQFGGSDEIRLDSPRAVGPDELRRLASEMPGGEHAWVIAVLHGIDDPEQALDDMELTGESFVGISPIHCLSCRAEYRTEIRHERCPAPDS